jgi:REase_DpnII-MboI
MARARAADHQRSRSKTALLEEVTRGIAKFEEVLSAIKDFSQEGFPYRDAAQSKAELQFRECLRHAFGERSQEFQTYRNFKLRTGDKAEAAQSVATIKGLIQTLEDRKLELQGLKPPLKPEPPLEVSANNTARMVLVSPAPSTTLTAPATKPTTIAVAMTTPAAQPSSPVPVIPQSQLATPEPLISHSISTPPPSHPIPTPVLPEPPWFSHPTPPSNAPTQLATAPSAQPIPAAPEILAEVDRIPPPLPSPAPASPPTQLHAVPTTSAVSTPVIQAEPLHPVASSPTPPASSLPPVPPAQPSVMSPTPAVTMPPETTRSVASPPQDSASNKRSTSASNARVIESALDQDPLHLIRKVCLRFHSVVRQLRLRKDYRPTIEVDDDYDLQDLLCALLKVEFDEVATDEWTPPYTAGASRTTFLVEKDQIAIIAKKTGPSVTTKELADQVAADSAYYRAQGRCSTLFCFMYDPEGRVGSPKRLETTLTSVSEHCTVEVLVAPK